MRYPIHPFLLSLCLVVSLLPAAVFADALILRDGTMIHTEGPWQEDGRRILYTNHHGIKTMIRTTEVDLEATKRFALAQPEKVYVESTREPPNVVAASRRTDKTPADIVILKGGAIDIGALAEDLGIQAPGPTPNRDAAIRLMSLRNRYLKRVLNVTASYDAARPSKYRNASPELRSIADDARRMSTTTSEPYIAEGLVSIADGIARAAHLAETDKNAFAAVLIDFRNRS